MEIPIHEIINTPIIPSKVIPRENIASHAKDFKPISSHPIGSEILLNPTNRVTTNFKNCDISKTYPPIFTKI